MSSRNNLLTSDNRLLAPEIYKRLCWIKENISNKSNEILIKDSIDFFKKKGLVPEYLKICDPDTLEDLNHFSGRALIAIAIKLGAVRLIDNILLD
jgi:pantoate--beta-alanine ligase